MTQSFDGWLKGKSPISGGFTEQELFEAGAQSKQAEIDEYKEVAESMEDAYLREKAKVDELRKRIDDAIDYLHDGNQRELSYEYADAINDVIDMLKGTTNEQ